MGVSESAHSQPMKPELRQPFLGLTVAFAVSALIAGLCLLLLDGLANFTSSPFHAAASATPLILIGLSWFCLHPGFGLSPIQFLKRLIAVVAFILWGITQLLPPGSLATIIGDVVIALFVLDLALVIKGELTTTPND